MRLLTASQIRADSIDSLGLDPQAFDLTSVEVVAALLRRAAAFFCPCSSVRLARAVQECLQHIVTAADVDDLIEGTLEEMISYGDLIEQSDTSEEGGRGLLVYAAPPSFVSRKSGGAVLIGIAPDSLSPLPPEVESSIEYVRYARRLPPHPFAEVRSLLLTTGFSELSEDGWLKAPRDESPSHLLARLNSALDAAPPSGDVPGLNILDPETPVTYYRGRWRMAKTESGRFVARRPQLYGAPIWCLAEVESGRTRRLVDLPFDRGPWRGSDEAWRIQAAIDASRDSPQRFRTRSAPEGDLILDLFSPVPTWARRRWESIGEPVPPHRSFFAYKIRQREAAEEVGFCQNRLWLKHVMPESSTGA